MSWRGWIGFLLLWGLGCASAPPLPPGGDSPGASEARNTTDSAASGPAMTAEERPAHVVFISIAGMEPWAYTAAPGQPPVMPNVGDLAKLGVQADVVTAVVPPTHFSTHATLVTGRRPDEHGIVSNQLLGEAGILPIPYWQANVLQGDSVWRSAVASNKGVAALGWPSTVGAEVEWLLPDVAPLRGEQQWLPLLNGTTTPWLLDRVKQDIPDPVPVGWPTPSERDVLLTDLACGIAQSGSPPALWLLRLSQPAGALRIAGPDSEEVRVALKAADQNVERLLNCLSKEGLLRSTAVVIVGDLVWQPVHSVVNPNVALRRARLIARDPRVATGVSAWQAIARSNGGSAFVYAKNEGAAIRAREVLRAEAERTRAFRIVSASEMSALRADPEAWFGLEAQPGYMLGDAVAGSYIVEPARFRGAPGYLQPSSERAAGFVAWGRGLRRRVKIPVLPAIDIAPTLAVLVGVPLRAEGRPLYGVLSFDPRLSKHSLPKLGPSQ